MGVARLVGAALAVLGPAFVLIAAALVASPAPSLGKQALVFDRLLRRAAPEVVVVGASFASADIDPEGLAGRLGVSADQVAVLPVYTSSAPVWYAVLKERVYGNGGSPSLILLPVSIGTALATRPSQGQVGQILDQMPTPDATVARRSMGGPLAARVRMLLAHRGDLRAPLLGRFRGLLPRLLLGADERALSRASTAALGELHGAADPRALPTVEADIGIDDSLPGSALSSPEESFLADIVDLAEAHGARVAVALPPVMLAATRGQRAPADLEEAAVRWAERRHVAWIDLRDLGWGAQDFRDNRHMRASAARRFTDLVADHLLADAEAQTSPSLARGSGLLASTVARVGTPPRLEARRTRPLGGPCELAIAVPGYEFLGQKALREVFPRLRSPLQVWEGDRLLQPGEERRGCSGTALHRAGIVVSRYEPDGPPLRLAWSEALPDGEGSEAKFWVYPGTSLVWTVPEPWPGAVGEASVELRVGALGPGEGVAELVVGEAAAPLERQGSRASASLPVHASGAWTVSVRSPEDGPFLFVERLDLRSGDQIARLVASEGPRGLELLPPGGWRAEVAPPATPRMKLRVDGAYAWFKTPWRAFSACSPLRVAHDGVLLPEAPPDHRSGKGGTRHVEGWLVFEPLPGTDPKDGYAVVYDPDRRCPPLGEGVAEQVWLYPGDALRGTISELERAQFAAPLERIRLVPTLAQAAPETATLTLRVALGQEPLLERTLAGAELLEPGALELSRPILPSEAGDLSVFIAASPDLPPTLLIGSLEER